MNYDKGISPVNIFVSNKKEEKKEKLESTALAGNARVSFWTTDRPSIVHWHLLLLDACLSNFERHPKFEWCTLRLTRVKYRDAAEIRWRMSFSIHETRESIKSASAHTRMADVIIVYYYFHSPRRWQWIMLLFCISVTVVFGHFDRYQNWTTQRPTERRTMEHFNWWHNFLVFPLCISFATTRYVTEHGDVAVVNVGWTRARSLAHSLTLVDVQKWVARDVI